MPLAKNKILHKRKYCLHLNSQRRNHKKQPKSTAKILYLENAKTTFLLLEKKITLTHAPFRRVSLLSDSYCQPVAKMKECISFRSLIASFIGSSAFGSFLRCGKQWGIIWVIIFLRHVYWWPLICINNIQTGTLFIMKETSTQTIATDLVSDVPKWAQLPPTFVLSTHYLLIP